MCLHFLYKAGQANGFGWCLTQINRPFAMLGTSAISSVISEDTSCPSYVSSCDSPLFFYWQASLPSVSRIKNKLGDRKPLNRNFPLPSSNPSTGAASALSAGGRTKAAAGVPSQPNVFYFGMVNGGVWKTDDYGRTWTPIFDDQPTASIGAVAVSLSDPNTVYVGSGEGLHRPDLSVGDGVYKSTDAGKTWTHLGLRDGQQIPQIAVDPHDPNKLLVAVAGHPYGPNPERGIFRSTDGGQTFTKVLYKDENTGGADVAD